MRWQSAPDIADLGDVLDLLGTREQVLAAITLQTALRRRWRASAAAALAAEASLAADASATAPASVAVDDGEATPPAVRTPDLHPCPLESMVINLDTGCAISIGESAPLSPGHPVAPTFLSHRTGGA